MLYLFEGPETSTNIVLGYALFIHNSGNTKVTTSWIEISQKQEKPDAIALVESHLTLPFFILIQLSALDLETFAQT